jgi:glycosyltransferase involved in cell wall biosynthesis
VEPPTIAVALCTHNGAAYVVDQVRSILSQSVMPSQIVVSDDASSDATVDLIVREIETFRLQQPNTVLDLRVIQNVNPLGVAGNFHQAILATDTDFIALCDQDDVWASDRIEVAVDLLLSRPEIDVVHSDATLIDGAGADMAESLFEALDLNRESIDMIHHGDALALLLRRNVVTGATMMFRRRLIAIATPFPRGWVHDEWIAIVAAATSGIDVIERPLIGYRQHGSNQIGVATLTTVGKLRRMLEPGANRSQRLLERAESFASWAATAEGITAELATAAHEKLMHERMRSALPLRRWARITPVLRELRTGRYRSFGRGTADAVRDLLQPLKPGQ